MTDEQTNLRYRRLAQHCVDMLANTSDPETRVALLEMAQAWMRLAEESMSGRTYAGTKIGSKVD
jgi:hypothetical protein